MCGAGSRAPGYIEKTQTAFAADRPRNSSFHVSMFWSPLLTAGQRTRLTPKLAAGWTEAVADFEYLLIGVGAHFGYEKGPRAEAMRKEGYEPLTYAGRLRFVRDSLETTIAALRRHGFGGTVIVLGAPNDHRMLPSGAHSEEGGCQGEFENQTLRAQHARAYERAPIAASSLAGHQTSAYVLDAELVGAFSEHFHTVHLPVAQLLAGRFDAHIGQGFAHNAEKVDCMHWCTGSGVPEVILGIVHDIIFRAAR